ncbi:MAG: 50S ribosomal protein L21e [Thermofilaceae archaeon]
MRHSKGYRNRMRKLLRKTPRERGRPGLSRLLHEYKEGDLVCIDICPNYVGTAPHKRYQGKVGTVVGVRGKAYLVKVRIGGKDKIIITTKDHLKPIKRQEVSAQA